MRKSDQPSSTMKDKRKFEVSRYATEMYRTIRVILPAWEEARLSTLEEAGALADEMARIMAPPDQPRVSTLEETDAFVDKTGRALTPSDQSSLPTFTIERRAVLQCTATVAICYAMILEGAAGPGAVQPVRWPEFTDDERCYLAMWMIANPVHRAALVLHHGLGESQEDVQAMLGETWTIEARNAFFYHARQQFRCNFEWLRCSPSCGCPRTLCCCLTDVRSTEQENGFAVVQSPAEIEAAFGTLASSLYWLRKERTHVK
ncbi:MAG TPA: hypothetical protein VMY37_20340 [Thermoguttaceae bacterium]|nr:hypothetical protein [Thermoguttaceae bacterium]